MSLAVWLGENRKCSAAVVGLDLLLGLSIVPGPGSIVRRCSLNRSFNRRFVSPTYCKLQRLHVDAVFSFTGQVRFYGVRFSRRNAGICSESVRNVGTSSTVFAAPERATRKLGIGRIRRDFSCTQ